MLIVTCPHCQKAEYSLSDLGVSEVLDTHATVTCSFCRQPFDLWVVKTASPWWKVWNQQVQVSAKKRGA